MRRLITFALVGFNGDERTARHAHELHQRNIIG
jgi:hypothetical protein